MREDIMGEKDIWQARERASNTVGVLVGIVALGVIGWFIALATHLALRLPSGFFAA